MDRNQIILLVVNAVITIVTTAIITRLSLNKGQLGIASKVKARFTPKFKAYMTLVLCLSVITFIALSLYRFATAPDPPPVSRSEVLLASIFATGLGIWSVILGYAAANLAQVIKEEKARKEREQWQPILDEVKKAGEEARRVLDRSNARRESPDDPSSDRPK